MAQNVTLVRPDGSDTIARLAVDTDAAAAERGLQVSFDPPPQRAMPPPPSPPPPAPLPPRPPPPPPPPQPQPEELNDFANPNKLADEESPVDDESPEYEEQFEDDFDQEFEDEQPQQYQAPPPAQPLPPFTTLEDERADLMFKLTRATRNGIQVRSFGYNADIRELRSEVTRVKAEQDVNASIAFQRQILMTICSGLEFANRKFSYMDLELDGWSESMMDDIGKYDNVFEKLHAKHAGRISVPPEIQLILMIGGSAMTWHLTKTMLGGGRSRDRGRVRDKKKKRRRSPSPSSEESSEESSEDESPRTRERRRYARPAPPPKKKQQQQQQPGMPREMRGPGFDVGGMMGLGGMGGMGGLGGVGSMLPQMMQLPQVPVPDLAPRNTRPTKQQPRIRELPPSASPSPPPSERLSDIPSEELDDIPSDLSPGESDDDDDDAGPTKVISFEAPLPSRGRGAGRGRGRGRGGAKNVIVI